MASKREGEKTNRNSALSARTRSPHHKIWDTNTVHKKDRLSYWRDGVCETILHCTIEVPFEQEFAARMTTTLVSNGSLTKLETTSNHFVQRRKIDIARTEGDYFVLKLHISGNTTYSTYGVERAVQPGRMTLMRSDRELSMVLPPGSPSSMLILLVKRVELIKLIGFEPQQDYIDISRDLLGSALFSCLATIAQRYLSASKQELNALFDASTAILAAGLLQDRDVIEESGKSRSVRSGLLWAMQAFIERNLANPHLAAVFVSKQFDVSSRYVQRLFAEENISCRDYILSERLERIYMDLLNPSFANSSISQMAIDCGFGDLSHFHRSFKARFGISPGEHRAMAKA